MKYVFDLRTDYSLKAHFQLFPTAVVAVHLPPVIGETLTLLVRGVIINNTPEHPGLEDLLPQSVRSHLPTSLYLAGWGTITFSHIHRGSIRVNPFAPRISPGDLKPLYDQAGKATQFILDRVETQATNGLDEYEFEFLLEQPLAHMSVVVTTSSPIQLAIDPSDCITFDQSCTEFDRYDHDWYRIRQLQEVKDRLG